MSVFVLILYVCTLYCTFMTMCIEKYIVLYKIYIMCYCIEQSRICIKKMIYLRIDPSQCQFIQDLCSMYCLLSILLVRKLNYIGNCIL